MQRGVEILIGDAAAETGEEDFPLVRMCTDKLHRLIDVAGEEVVGPSLQLLEVLLHFVRRHVVGAIVHRPEVDSVGREVERERMLGIVRCDDAVHVGAGQVEDDEVGMLGRGFSGRYIVQPDLVEGRGATNILEAPLGDRRARP